MSGQVWVTNSLGGYMWSPNLSQELRVQVTPRVKFRQFCDVHDASQQGLGKGQEYHWNVYSTVTNTGGTLTETTTMQETNFTITQGTLTITEYGNSVPYSGKLDDLSAQPVKEIINKVLKIDAAMTFDRAAHTQFNLTPLRVCPTNGTDTAAVTLTTNGTCSTTNTIAMSTNHVKSIVDLMKERNIPPYMGDDYYCLAWPTTYRGFKNTLETLKVYTETGFGMIMNGEIGRYESVRYVEQTNIGKGIANDGVAWSQAKSDWAYFFGADTVAEGIGLPEEMRAKIPTDYGRSKGIAWYYLGGFGLIHGSSNNAVNARIVKWDSKA